MVSLKALYYNIAAVVKDVCDKTYYKDRPTSIDGRIDSYLVISMPSAILNNEISDNGEYNDYSTTLLLEVYVRDTMSSKNPIGIDLKTMDEKVTKVLGLFPINTAALTATEPTIVLQDNDDSGFHVTLIRARLRTK